MLQNVDWPYKHVMLEYPYVSVTEHFISIFKRKRSVNRLFWNIGGSLQLDLWYLSEHWLSVYDFVCEWILQHQLIM